MTSEQARLLADELAELALILADKAHAIRRAVRDIPTPIAPSVRHHKDMSPLIRRLLDDKLSSTKFE
jgi:hypothetical protein